MSANQAEFGTYQMLSKPFSVLNLIGWEEASVHKGLVINATYNDVYFRYNFSVRRSSLADVLPKSLVH